MRSLDQWYVLVNGVYIDANFDKSEAQIFMHLQEVIGGLSEAVSEKSPQHEVIREYMPKAIAWWLSLAGKINVASVEQMLWMKFPGVCPYCLRRPHSDADCKLGNPSLKAPNWARLAEESRERRREISSIGDWQRSFRKIYPVVATEKFDPSFAKIVEEMGELAAAIRVRKIAPTRFLSEAADVFAWLMRIQSIHDLRWPDSGGIDSWMEADYPDLCKDCGESTCICPAVLEAAIGRLTADIPADLVPKALIPLEDTVARFRHRTMRLAGHTRVREPFDLDGLQSTATAILAAIENNADSQGIQNAMLLDILESLRRAESVAVLTDDKLAVLQEGLAELEPSTRKKIEDIASSLGSNFASWLIQLVLTGGTGSFV